MEGDSYRQFAVGAKSISIHSLRMEGDDFVRSNCRHNIISIHSLRMEGDPAVVGDAAEIFRISIHSLRMEGDRAISGDSWKRPAFQSTPSAWRETNFCAAGADCLVISIHSLRMEGDKMLLSDGVDTWDFNPLPPHGGRLSPVLSSFDRGFQSTPSAWRETQIITSATQNMDISIHSLRMEGDSITPLLYLSALIFQSTPSAWRETRKKNAGILQEKSFQSTPSAWRETQQHVPVPWQVGISIHSLRMEGDLKTDRSTP